LLKFADNPPVISPDLGEAGISAFTGRWWVGHTKARCEKAFAWDLRKAGVSYFLPMVERVTFSGGRKRRGMNALFPSYVFFCGSDEARQKAMLTGRLCQVIVVPDQQTLRAELRHIDVALRQEATLDPYPFAFVGRRCRVKSGPFLGIEGTVVQRQSVVSLVLEVRLLGQAVALQIDTDVLEAVDDETGIQVRN
jgi:transcription antitermination factor NusG